MSAQYVLSLTVTLLFSFFASAASFSDRVEKLLQRPTRPTVSEFLMAFDGTLPPHNPFGKPSPGMSFALDDGAKMISALEKVYPGGVYASLGRDAVNITDLFEAYYLSKGEKNRTARVEISRQSFPLDMNTFARYLADRGLNIDKTTKNKKTFVIVDRTSFRNVSQSMHIYNMVSGFLGPTQPGEEPRFTMATTYVQTNRHGYDTNHTGIDKNYLETQKANGSFLFLNSQFTDLTAWHDSFFGLSSQNGKVQATPGALMPRELRLTVLSDLYEIVKVANSGRFQNAIDNYSKSFGFTFPYGSHLAELRTRYGNLDIDTWKKFGPDFLEALTKAKNGNSNIDDWAQFIRDENLRDPENARLAHDYVSQNMDTLVKLKSEKVYQVLYSLFKTKEMSDLVIKTVLANEGISLDSFDSYKIAKARLPTGFKENFKEFVLTPDFLEKMKTDTPGSGKKSFAETILEDNQYSFELFNEFLPSVKTFDEFVRLISYKGKYSSPKFNELISKYLVSNTFNIQELNPTQVQLRDLLNKYPESARGIREHIVKQPKNLDNYMFALQHELAESQDERQSRIGSLILNSINTFLTMKPSDDQVRYILKNVSTQGSDVVYAQVLKHYGLGKLLGYGNDRVNISTLTKIIDPAVIAGHSNERLTKLMSVISQTAMADILLTPYSWKGTRALGDFIKFSKGVLSPARETLLAFMHSPSKELFIKYAQQMSTYDVWGMPQVSLGRTLADLRLKANDYNEILSALNPKLYPIQEIFQLAVNSAQSKAELNEIVTRTLQTLDKHNMTPHNDSASFLAGNQFSDSAHFFEMAKLFHKHRQLSESLIHLPPSRFTASQHISIMQMLAQENPRLLPSEFRLVGRDPLMIAHFFFASGPSIQEVQDFVKIFEHDKSVYSQIHKQGRTYLASSDSKEFNRSKLSTDGLSAKTRVGLFFSNLGKKKIQSACLSFY